ncbi:alkaline phosphatase family protein [Mariniphaga sediminis]|uniref:alkaline phosphatase family protein n=1 Tax=Mariniphaga sediminis TaxID=1628158 RepID=UPI00356B5C7E
MKIKTNLLSRKMFGIISLALLFVSCNVKENKVLIIGIDGCRPDSFIKANTPSSDSLMKTGAYTFNAKTDEISSSGICWTGMLTGVWHDKHKVVTNSYKNPNIEEYPHFFRRVKQFNPELKTYSVIQWTAIHKILQEGDADVVKTFGNDDLVTDEVVRNLTNEDVDVMFVQLDDVDHAGHKYDYVPESENYIQAVEKADSQIGRMVNALKKRENYKNENWLVIVSTDHGGSNFGHGQNIPEHTTIFYIASGENATRGEIKEQVNVVDVCITAMKHLGMEIKEEWSLDGKVVGLIN